MQPRHFIWVSLLATTLALIATSAALLLRTVPATEAVRLRNSLLADVGAPGDFAWSPAETPEDFLQEHTTEVPEPLQAFVRREALAVSPSPSPADERGLSLRMVSALGHDLPRGQPIQSDTLGTFREIMSRGGGYCADYTQVFNGLAYAAGIPVREWGMSFDGFGGDGHAFNEIYDRTLGQWVMIDVFNAFYPADRESGRPLSLLEFRERLLTPGVLVTTRLEPVGQGLRFDSPQAAVDYYRRGLDGLYLWWGNNVLSYDDSPAPALAGRLSRTAEQVIAIALGVHPRFRILPVRENRRAIQALQATRDSLLLHAAALALLSVAFLAQIVALAVRSGRSAARSGS